MTEYGVDLTPYINTYPDSTGTFFKRIDHIEWFDGPLVGVNYSWSSNKGNNIRWITANPSCACKMAHVNDLASLPAISIPFMTIVNTHSESTSNFINVENIFSNGLNTITCPDITTSFVLNSSSPTLPASVTFSYQKDLFTVTVDYSTYDCNVGTIIYSVTMDVTLETAVAGALNPGTPIQQRTFDLTIQCPNVVALNTCEELSPNVFTYGWGLS